MDPTFLNRAAPPGSMRYLAALYAPERAREWVYAVYLVETEIRESAISASHDVAHTRLRWWREEIERLNQGRPQHPATRLLAHGPRQPDWTQLQQLLFAADIELSRMTFDTERELQAYLERSGGVVQQLIAQVIREDELPDTLRAHARGLGALARHAEVLRDLRREAHAGRIYLPLDQLEAAKIPHTELGSEQASAPLREIVAAQARRSLDQLQQHERALNGADRASLRPVLVFAALHARLLQRLARGEYSPKPPLELGPMERIWLAWRAAVRAR
jgi:15-cis-phytoene synthase